VARRMILVNDFDEVMLSEVEAVSEGQLQGRLKDSPDLLTVEELGLTGPLLVVGRETTLPSGAADLLALGPTGDLIVIEMKTGPQNSDFRAALAQATDYGADLLHVTHDGVVDDLRLPGGHEASTSDGILDRLLAS
jgi:RecB family endonuclease NucS